MISDKRCLVTGAGGFIGSHLARRLVDLGADTVALVSEVSAVTPPRLAPLKSRIRVTAVNLTDYPALRATLGEVKPDVIFHLAAFTHVGKSFSRVDECIATNFSGTANLVRAAESAGCELFVNAGTSEIYGDVPPPFREDGPVRPVSPYALTKSAAESFCLMFHRAYGFPAICLRPFNAFGPAQSPDRVIPEIITSALAGNDVELTEGIQTREFNYVTDIVEGFVMAADAGAAVVGEVINIGCGEERSMANLAESILDLMGNPVKVLKGAIPYRPTEIWNMYADTRKAKELLGWQPKVSFEEGLRATIDWYRAESRKEDSPFIP